MPTVHLFVPCYIDQLYPEVGMATVQVLERAGCTVIFNDAQTCCGQPMANSGCAPAAAQVARHHLDVFKGADAVVCPSGSCVSMVTHHYQDLGLRLDDADQLTLERTFELGDFLVNRLKITDLGARYPGKVALHRSCHGLRELGLGSMSERRDGTTPSPAQILLENVRDLELVHPQRCDECCGFGGTFAVAEAMLSARMGEDRCADLAATGALIMTATDMSCLMHLDGIAKRSGGPRAVHLAQILASQ